MNRFRQTPRLGARRRPLRVQALERRQVFAAGIDITPTADLVTSEDGGAVDLQVRLTEAPTSDVTVNVFLGDTTESQADPGVMLFTPENWDAPQALKITGRDDLLEDGDLAYSIALTADSADLNYALLPARVLSLVNQDNEADIPPRVLAVAFDGTDSVYPEYLVPSGSGEQLRTIPVGSLNQVRVYFNQPVNVSSGDLVISGVQTPLHAIQSFEYDATTYSATWTFADIVYADRLTLTLADAVTDSSAFALDGEWDGPMALNDPSSSAFPSGDGAAGGAFLFHATVLAGDGNRDNVVTGGDFTIWVNHFFEPPGSVTFSEGDYNGDGRATGADFTLWSNTFGVTFPPLALAAGGSGTGPRGSAFDAAAPRASTPLVAAPAAPRREAPAAAARPRGRQELRLGLEEFS